MTDEVEILRRKAENAEADYKAAALASEACKAAALAASEAYGTAYVAASETALKQKKEGNPT